MASAYTPKSYANRNKKRSVYNKQTFLIRQGKKYRIFYFKDSTSNTREQKKL